MVLYVFAGRYNYGSCALSWLLLLLFQYWQSSVGNRSQSLTYSYSVVHSASFPFLTYSYFWIMCSMHTVHAYIMCVYINRKLRRTMDSLGRRRILWPSRERKEKRRDDDDDHDLVDEEVFLISFSCCSTTVVCSSHYYSHSRSCNTRRINVHSNPVITNHLGVAKNSL